MNGKTKWCALFLLVVVGAVFTYVLVRPGDSERIATEKPSAKDQTKKASAVFRALNLPGMAADFVPNPGETSVLEDKTQTDVNTGFHRKYYAIVFDRGDVEPFVDKLRSDLSSMGLNDEIEVLNRFEREIQKSVEDAGGKVTSTIAGRGTHGGDSIHTRYCFDYDCGNGHGAIRVWIIARSDQCTLLLLVTEQIS